MLLCYCAAFILFIAVTQLGSDAVTVIVEHSPVERRNPIAIDAGHGGIDGGAVSLTGMPESQINLQIAERLEDLFHLLGYPTYMLRNTDTSLHTEGTTISAQKISDLKQRVQLVKEKEASLLISIHQNTFSDKRYSGAQVFYRNEDESQILALRLQNNFIKSLQPASKRKPKQAKGIYLMEHISCPGILIECGFLTNAQEEAMLRDPSYQKRLCAVIAATVSLGKE
jgi:N-acetylmuramoyl-L-alanine amidase